MSTGADATLVCPKCQGAMRSYERSGITIDQCGECRGVFLDRGELEKLIDAESAVYEGGGAQGREAEAPWPAQRGGHHGGGGQHGGQRGGRRRGSFLGELFD